MHSPSKAVGIVLRCVFFPFPVFLIGLFAFFYLVQSIQTGDYSLNGFIGDNEGRDFLLVFMQFALLLQVFIGGPSIIVLEAFKCRLYFYVLVAILVSSAPLFMFWREIDLPGYFLTLMLPMVLIYMASFGISLLSKGKTEQDAAANP